MGRVRSGNLHTTRAARVCSVKFCTLRATAGGQQLRGSTEGPQGAPFNDLDRGINSILALAFI
ncbi:hypothetical protein RHMOL_Rhmol08G0174400 [Rhododendron molle]|uniref:Uncharacterized protein n=1 Tax=Rhododendron molle TaxID=49168 RepID=A0ACC0MPQ0_RHOML|nr:hypothetical protein RHMOL_Rhmol08G0174400 [Rhododendron molle]